ncbi:MAG: hypothetical protein BGP03_16505 [Pseudonocardia sp. 73-21]|nr:MAG: hypothetical protein BGP03_16505 [Pseudonocardia sp. 73-21]
MSAFPGFPNAAVPLWTAWLAFGHLAVVVFITLSGFSLAVGPARAGWQLGPMRCFLRRRAWRILPPYWAALAFSMIVAVVVVPQPGEGVPTAKSAVVFGVLLQDVFGSPSPNGAFWSIAVEAQLYLVMPLLLFVRRRWGAVVVLAVVCVPAIAVELLSGRLAVAALLERFVPQMAVLFAAGVVAATVLGSNRDRAARIPWGVLSAVGVLPPLALILLRGQVWSVENFFWVDLAICPAIVFLLAGLSVGRANVAVRVLDTRPLRGLGSFSYSLYLVHAPIVIMVDALAAHENVPFGLPRLLVLVATAVPLSVLFAWLFARVFELPFQRHRSSRELLATVRTNVRRTKATALRESGTRPE